MEDLMAALKQFGQVNEKEVKKQSTAKPCSFCESQGFANRFHDESVCRLKKGRSNATKNEKIRVVNNTEAQNVISMAEEAKNAQYPL